ncbi:MAG TPA: PDZ domain-containing protein [Steroidobacteraceae bacterium]|nr:PDZ domain-containing protein [Steroidobacteraceae bacterium]
MNRHSLLCAWIVALVACGAAASCRPSIALGDPLPAASPGDTHTASEADLEAQLEAARKQLEAAAHQVAELTAQLSRPVIEKFMALGDDPDRAIIGVQLDPAGDPQGARVREVSPGGPAAEAGIRAGDVIVAVNDTAVKGDDAARQVVDLMRNVKPDSKVRVRVLRDGKPRDFTVVARAGLGYLLADGPITMPGPELLPHVRAPLMLRGPLTDLELVTLSPQLGRYFGSDSGVLVVHAPGDGALKLEDGDVILAIDGRRPTSGSHATRILASYQPGEKLTLHIVRLHKTLDVEATVPERPHHRGVMLRGHRAASV